MVIAWYIHESILTCTVAPTNWDFEVVSSGRWLTQSGLWGSVGSTWMVSK